MENIKLKRKMNYLEKIMKDKDHSYKKEHLSKEIIMQSEHSIHQTNREEKEKNTKKKDHKQSETTLIIGDSMLKNINPRGLVKKTNTILYTFNTIGFIEKEKPARALLHVGMNDVKRKLACEIIQDFENLAKTIHSISPASKIIFSGIVKRKQRNKDNTTINSKVVDENNDLKALCTREVYI